MIPATLFYVPILEGFWVQLLNHFTGYYLFGRFHGWKLYTMLPSFDIW